AAKPPPPKPAPSKPVPPKPAPPTPPAPPAPSEPAVKPAFVPLKRLSSLPPKAGPKPARIKPAGESEAERISRIRGGLKRTDLGRAVAQALASPGGAPGGMAGGSFDAAAIGSSIRGQVRNAITTGSFSTQGGGRATASQSASYFADLSSRLHSLWNQPSRSEIGGGRPRAVVSLTIAGDGRVLGTRLTRPSNRPAMDASIQSLLAGLSRLAAPADFGITGNSITVVVNFELD
ncbi:MAG: TonB C-terminal domain-containing protein, partial [Lentisphaeria bacterium]